MLPHSCFAADDPTPDVLTDEELPEAFLMYKTSRTEMKRDRRSRKGNVTGDSIGQEPVDKRTNVSTVTPEDYPAEDRTISRTD